jgi:CRP/FNR family transcriptional regulator, cyclic AMP receptor protein
MINASIPSPKINSNKNILNRNEITFKRGSLMFIEGDTTTEMYILRSGKVRILKQEGDNAIELAVLGPGSVLGELSLLDHQPRGATGQVIEETTATVIDESLFSKTLALAPSWLTGIIKMVVKRLRDTMKKTDDDIVRKSVAGAIRVLLLVYANEGFSKDNMHCLLLSRAKDFIFTTIGLGALEAEQVFLHLILKDLIMIRKNELGREYIIIKNTETLQLYMNFLRAKQRATLLAGEGLSENAIHLIEYIVAATEKNGKKIKESLYSLGQPQVELEMERAGKGRFIDRDALDELTAAKIILLSGDSCESKYGTHARTSLIFNMETLKKILMLTLWLPVFKEEITF